ncbi:hypothetical protein AMAG_11377 [Allomyces macrogynus ATCC 38327]|uniref:Uncharacterized protein n=1 Tax=Allomyces macrogynus (strain ATCC 38327) TaxID=578462 RepID=A0A0L0SX21_ALLM3|nr:hypothetical protein AMAG_11377 [Allomyces macrogynus ATCC 38327]|eukprot:KNE66904.1 hypothetical protein AMAG_11377 [Allomyces macrogynus ATCC 38327]
MPSMAMTDYRDDATDDLLTPPSRMPLATFWTQPRPQFEAIPVEGPASPVKQPPRTPSPAPAPVPPRGPPKPAQNDEPEVPKKDTTEDVAFLKALVGRLNSELARCKDEKQFMGEKTNLSEFLASGEASWLWDADSLSPLLSCFDELVTKLLARLAEYENQVPELVDRCEALVAENEDLHSAVEDLKGKLSAKEDGAHAKSPAPASAPPPLPRSTTNPEDKLAIQQNQQLRKEGQKLRHELHFAHRHFPQSTKTRQSLHTQSQLADAMTDVRDLESERDHLADSLRRRDVDAHNLSTRVKDLQAALHAVTARFQDTLAELEAAANSNKAMVAAVRAKDEEVVQLVAQAQSTAAQVKGLMEQHQKMHEAVESLEDRVKDGQAREDAYLVQLKNADERAEGLRIDRDRLATALDESSKQVDELRKLVDEVMASSVAKREFTKVKTEAEVEVARLTAELEALRSTHATTMNQLERALRDKRTVDEELRAVQRNAPNEHARMRGVIEELSAKLRACERERNNLMYQQSVMQDSLERANVKSEQGRQSAAENLQHQTRRATKAEALIEDLREDNAKFSAKYADAQTAMEELGAQKDRVERQAQSNVTLLTRKYEGQIKKLRQDLDRVTAQLKTVSDDLRSSITKAHEQQTRWKAEHDKLAHDYETLVLTLRTKLSDALVSKDEALRELRSDKTARHKLHRELQETKATMAVLQQKYRDAALHSEELSLKLQEAVRAQVEMRREKRALQRRMDRIIRKESAFDLANLDLGDDETGSTQRTPVAVMRDLPGRLPTPVMADPDSSSNALALHLEAELRRIRNVR